MSPDLSLQPFWRKFPPLKLFSGIAAAMGKSSGSKKHKDLGAPSVILGAIQFQLSIVAFKFGQWEG